MKSRTLGRTSIAVGEIGLGCEHLAKKTQSEVCSIVDAALDAGMNLFDVFMPEPQVRTAIGNALANRRSDVLLQGHIGATYQNGQYEKDHNAAHCKIAVEDFLTRYHTDYIDIGMLHFVDSEQEYGDVFERGLLEYALELKKKGIVRFVGMSSHNARIARRAVETGVLDVLMFSINPFFDATGTMTDIFDYFTDGKMPALSCVNEERAALYSVCEQKGTAITVMKALAAGQLLRDDSPVGKMTVAQCIHYALGRPAVASVLVGCQSVEEVLQAAAYEPTAESNYTLLGSVAAYSSARRCMYCNHCLPCPSGIDIAAVTKYLDLARLSPEEDVPPTVRAHYASLPVRAGECIACGRCEDRCPFGVRVIENMNDAAKLFE